MTMGGRVSKLLWALLRIWRYPEYLRLCWYRAVTPAQVRRQGVALGGPVVFWGAPIIACAPDTRIEIGAGSVLCSRAEYTALGVNHPVVLRTLAPGASISIGAGVRMSGATICAARQVAIGARCCLGANVTIADTDFHALDPAVRASRHDAEGAASAPVEIGEDVFLGTNCLILKGVRIGRGAVVGAGAVVVHDVAPYSIVAGNPARQVGQAPGRPEAERIDAG